MAAPSASRVYLRFDNYTSLKSLGVEKAHEVSSTNSMCGTSQRDHTAPPRYEERPQSAPHTRSVAHQFGLSMKVQPVRNACNQLLACPSVAQGESFGRLCDLSQCVLNRRLVLKGLSYTLDLKFEHLLLR